MDNLDNNKGNSPCNPIDDEQQLTQITLSKQSLDTLKSGAELLADIMTCLALGDQLRNLDGDYAIKRIAGLRHELCELKVLF